MQFEPYNSRRLLISEATKGELKDYKLQTKAYKSTDNIIISAHSNTLYLAIKTTEGKLIGIIQVLKIRDIDEEARCMKISIPNESWRLRYGTEAVRQFVKCCSARKICKRIYPQIDNEIIKAYKKERPAEFELDGLAIHIA